MGANIPLPALTTFHPEDPSEQLMRAVQLSQLVQNAPLQRQAMQQEVQGRSLQNQQSQMNIQSQQALMRAYTEAQGDPDRTVQLAAKYGALPKDVIATKNAMLDQKMKTADYVSKMGDLAAHDANLMQGAHDAVAAAPSEQRPAVYQQQLQGLSKQLADPSQLQQMPQQYPGDQAFQFIGAAVKSHTQMVDDQLKQSEQFKNTQQGNDAAANAAQKNAQTQAYQGTGLIPGLSPDEQSMISYMRTVPGAKAENYPAYKAAQDAKGRLAVENSPLAIAGAGMRAAAEAKGKASVDDASVVAFDPNYQNADGSKGGNVVLTRAEASTRGLQHYKANAETLNGTIAGFNDVQTKLNQLATVANDRNTMSQVQPQIAGAMLEHKGGIRLDFHGIGVDTSMINATLYNEDVKRANPATRAYVTATLAAHEALTQLPRLQTFGKSSRTTQQQMEAAHQMLPIPEDDADMAARKMISLQTTIDPLRKQVPHMPGADLIPSWTEQSGRSQPQRNARQFPQSMPSLMDLLK